MPSFTDISNILNLPLKWYALYTKGRHEKFVEDSLLRKGVEVYLPKRRIKKYWSDRVKIIEEPIFKSYLFAKFSLQDKLKIVSQKGVVNIVHFKSQYIPVPDEVINSLKILVDKEIKIDPYPYLKVGDRVCVRQGLLKGIEGFIVEKRSGQARVVISIDAINASISCVVEIDSVERA